MAMVQAPRQAPPYFFLLRSGTTVTLVGMTTPAEMGLEGEVSFFGFFTSLPLR